MQLSAISDLAGTDGKGTKWQGDIGLSATQCTWSYSRLAPDFGQDKAIQACRKGLLCVFFLTRLDFLIKEATSGLCKVNSLWGFCEWVCPTLCECWHAGAEHIGCPILQFACYGPTLQRFEHCHRFGLPRYFKWRTFPNLRFSALW